MIAIVDYGMGNVSSVANMLDYLGCDAVLSRDPAVIGAAERLVLPGVGSFDRGMRHLREFGLLTALEETALARRVPVLGICLGMQLLSQGSEEGVEPGLGWIEAQAVRFAFAPGSPLKVPHMGWSEVRPTKLGLLFPQDSPPLRFYFVHSYYVRCDQPADVAAECDYGGRFCCAVSRGNIHGVQFHPEKSHRFGMELLRRFVAGE